MERTHKLKSYGLKATLPRLKLFEQSAQRHLAAEDVYRQMLTVGIDLNLATVYRVLTQFEQNGLLKKANWVVAKPSMSSMTKNGSMAISCRWSTALCTSFLIPRLRTGWRPSRRSRAFTWPTMW